MEEEEDDFLPEHRGKRRNRAPRIEDIKYVGDKPDLTPFILPTYEALEVLQLPEDTYELSLYIDCAMQVVEKAAMTGEIKVSSFSRISQELARFFLTRRHTVAGDQLMRQSLWLLRSRVDYLIYHAKKTPNYGVDPTLQAYLESRQIYTTRGSLVKTTQIVFWDLMMALVERFNYLKYNPLLSRLVDYLYTAWGRFTFLAEKNPRVLNHIVLSEKTSDQQYVRCSENFIDDTEMLFSGLHKRLLFAEYLMKNKTVVVPKLGRNGIQGFFKWIIEMTSNQFRDIVIKKFRRRVHNGHVYVGERERCSREEALPIAAASANRAISMYRESFADQLSAFCSTDPIPKLIERNQKLFTGAPDEGEMDLLGLAVREVDVDFELLALMCLDCYFSTKSFSIEKYVWFRWEDEETLPLYDCSLFYDERFQREEPSKHFPMLVQYFNEFAVLFRGTLYIAPDIISCFAQWVRVAQEAEDVRGKLPDGKADTHELFRILWPDENIVNITADPYAAEAMEVEDKREDTTHNIKIVKF